MSMGQRLTAPARVRGPIVLASTSGLGEQAHVVAAWEIRENDLQIFLVGRHTRIADGIEEPDVLSG